MSRSLAKVHPKPPSPEDSTLPKKIYLFIKARNNPDGFWVERKNLQDEYRQDIIDHLMNHAKTRTYEDLMVTNDGKYYIPDPLFLMAVRDWQDAALVKAVISTAKRIGVFQRLKDTQLRRLDIKHYAQAEDVKDALRINGFMKGKKTRRKKTKSRSKF